VAEATVLRYHARSAEAVADLAERHRFTSVLGIGQSGVNRRGVLLVLGLGHSVGAHENLLVAYLDDHGVAGRQPAASTISAGTTTLPSDLTAAGLDSVWVVLIGASFLVDECGARVRPGGALVAGHRDSRVAR